ncbi:MAG: TonB-dependent receptor plug domain-containing protein [Gammaproteobacteria bacterium]|nr:TonB-dependent receptor plug domain-containing protein [Gammaproteobacteria bacterium]
MNRLDEHRDLTWRKSGSAFAWLLSVIAGLALSIGVATAQEEAGDAEEEEALELADVRVTGSRLNRPPSELSGNLIVLDRDDIRASGELTLARVLRQLPQNVNATNETYGSELNGSNNVTGASTVNLRGLGSESTLILVDGRRVGYSGLLGGVTDISSIPLSMVDRIEILLDGASAVYGSDAVGGVVNIITRKDYSGVELDLNYGRPHRSGYEETRVNISTGFSWDGGRANVGYEYFRDSGLDASNRDSIILANRDDSGPQQRGLPGPQVRLYTYFFDRSCNAARALVYELDGAILSRDEYGALSADDQARATCHADITVPPGFMPGDDLNNIDIFGAAFFGESAELGYSLRPEQDHNVINVAVDQAISDSITAHGNVRWGTKKTTSNGGVNGFSGTLHAGSPYNPFGVRTTVVGQILNAPPRLFESDRDELFLRLGLDGSIGSNWTWQAEFSSSEEEIDSQRFNVSDNSSILNGLNSDGVSESIIGRFSGIDQAACAAKQEEIGGTRFTYSSFFGGNCTVWGAPPTPINPFGDLTSYIAEGLTSGSSNEQTQFEALARGELFNAPGGAIALVVGFDYRSDVLDSFSEFHSTVCSLRTSCEGESPVGAQAFNTRIERETQAGFFEGLVPLIGTDNAMPGVQRLNITFSGRYDSYSGVEVQYRESQSGEAGTDEPADPGSEFTYSTGIVYRVNDTVQLKADRQTSFVAPQLNQLLQRTQERVPSQAFRGLYFTEPDALGRTQTHTNVFNNTGGNDKLRPETAETLSLTAELSPAFLPGIFLRASWSDTDIEDRIAFFSSLTGINPNMLPTNVVYVPEEDIYLRDNRWINVSTINRTGIDYELRYEWEMGLNDYSIVIRRSYTNKFDVIVDPAQDEPLTLVSVKDSTVTRRPILAPVPRHQTSAQFTWTSGGLFVSLDLQGAAKTTNKRFGFDYETEPATIYDMVVGYEFGNDTFFDAPAWMNGLSTTLTVNNLTNAYPKNIQTNTNTGEVTDYSINPFFEWTQGRSYRLAIHKSF